MRRFYLDTNATYGVAPEVQEFLSSAKNFTYLNPSSVCFEGQKLRTEVDAVRRDLYTAIGVKEQDYHLIFTSGATEANNIALLGSLISEDQDRGGNVVSSAIEHSSVSSPLSRIESLGIEVRRIPPEVDQAHFIENFLNAVDENTKLVTLMCANNESGQIFPVAEIFNEIRNRYPSCILHTDAVQSFGKLPLNFDSFPFDFLSCSPHKFGGLPGIGFSLISKRTPQTPHSLGGTQEGRWRPGTENTLGILSLGEVLSKLKTLPELYDTKVRSIRDRFEGEITKTFPGITVVAGDAKRLPNTSLMHFSDLRSDDLMVSLDLAGVSCSAGSACSSGKSLGADTVRFMGFPDKVAHEVIRFSFSAEFPEEDLDELISRVTEVISRAKRTIEDKGVSI